MTDSLHVWLLGDLCLAGDVETRLLSAQPPDLFDGLRNVIAADDLLVANVECAISDHGTPVSGKWATLRVHPHCVQSITRINVANLGNNHISDYGDVAARHTRELLEGAGVRTVGYGRDLIHALEPCIVEKNGCRVGFISFSCLTTNGRNYAAFELPGVAALSAALLRQSVDSVRPHVDALFVLLHWGLEQKRFPVVDQVRLGHRAIEWGANAVIGCHGHVIQPIESYQGGWIMYGLGNFLFADVPYTHVRQDSGIETGIVRQNTENLESLAVQFSVTRAKPTALVRLEQVLAVKVEEGYRPSIVDENQLTVDPQALIRRQKQLIDRWPDLWEGDGEVAYRTIVDTGGRLSHFYDPATPIDEIVRAPAVAAPRSKFARIRGCLRAALHECRT